MSVQLGDIRIGTAGWAMPAAMQPADQLARADSALVRYARRLTATEVNSSFHRHHRPGTWARWGQSTPVGFRFAAKVPKAVTHGARLDPLVARPVLDQFLAEARELGDRHGPLLVQLPPSLELDPRIADAFFTALRERWSGGVACEPRHASWFGEAASELLVDHRIARVAADPARVPEAAETGGWTGFAYVRLHGSPRTYYSSYDATFLTQLADRLRKLAAGPATDVWCTFDNTAGGEALPNALALQALLA